jgi:CubicO group peptidase (beta-lactamase class C family)
VGDSAEVLERAAASNRVESAVQHVTRRDESFTRHFGKAGTGDAMFALDSISKPINVEAVMTPFDRGEFRLDDRVRRLLPAFDGDGRGDVTIRHPLSHTPGRPDQSADTRALGACSPRRSASGSAGRASFGSCTAPCSGRWA